MASVGASFLSCGFYQKGFSDSGALQGLEGLNTGFMNLA